jgi:cobalt-zinc-cadmium efflux system protein
MQLHQRSGFSINTNRAFIIGICLNSVFVIFEIIAGFYSNSLSLLSDAFHNLSDVTALALALFAYKLSFRKSTNKFTYGFKKSTILAPVLNATILLIVIGAVGFEAVVRLQNPQPVYEKSVIVVAFVGIIINSISAILFLKDKNRDLNIRAAFIHLAGDAMISAGVVITGIIILFTDWYWLDAIASLLIILVIIRNTYNVLWGSFRLSLDAVPADINVSNIRENIMRIKGIVDIHDLHVWSMSSTETAMTVHAVLNGNPDMKSTLSIKSQINDLLKKFNIFHTTIEFEHQDNPCEQHDC